MRLPRPNRGEVSVVFAAFNMLFSGWLVLGRTHLLGYGVLALTVLGTTAGAIIYARVT